jgi:hypothetical protein
MFPQFARLPPEIQLKVWEAACAGPSMHVFDICIPLGHGDDRRKQTSAGNDNRGIRRLRQENTNKLGRMVFLDEAKSDPRLRHAADPSWYKWRQNLTRVSVDAAAVAAMPLTTAASWPGAARQPIDLNDVYLPGPERYVCYDNGSDILHLRINGQLRSALGAATDTVPCKGLPCPSQVSICLSSGLSQLLDAEWSPGMANAVQAARRVALDVADIWTDSTLGPLIMEEVAFLACTLQSNLEVLYLVDYCAGRCSYCAKQALRARNLQVRGNELDRELHGGGLKDEFNRAPDVVQGFRVAYREIFELEKLGWTSCHPTFVFARILDEAIRSQQADGLGESLFRGVRVLMVEDED